MLLEVNNITKAFGGLLALNHLSFHIEEGEILGLIGPNGAGKTTAFNVISGFHKPDSGLIRFMGKNISGHNASEICREGIARTFQQVKTFPTLTGSDNVVCGAFCRTSNLEEAKREASRTIAWIGLDKERDTVVKELTLAERKLVEIGRAVATKPKLLLLDEVVAGLNPTEVDRMIGLVKEINKSGITLIVVEHVMKVVMSVSDRIVVLDQGAKVAEGTPQEVSENKEVIKVYLGEAYA